MSDANHDYLLGDSDPEIHRLGVQHRLWAESTYASWRRAEIGPGDHVLDFGAGPGFTAVELAQWVGPQGRVVALDQSERFVGYLNAYAATHGVSNIETVHSRIEDVHFEDRFDVIYARWVFCFLRDPGAVVQRLAEYLKPGGRLVTLDYFNYRAFAVAPRIPIMAKIVETVWRSWAEAGGSLEVQGDMGYYMTEAGLAHTHARLVSGAVRPGEALWSWPRSFLRAYLPKLVEGGKLKQEEVDEFWSCWNDRIEAGGSYLFLPPLLEIHGRKPETAA